jgi:hypothetical protein
MQLGKPEEARPHLLRGHDRLRKAAEARPVP